MTLFQTPPPLPTQARVSVGDVVYVRARVVSIEDGKNFLPPGYLRLEAIDSTLTPIREGCHAYLFDNEVITRDEMRNLIQRKA